MRLQEEPDTPPQPTVIEKLSRNINQSSRGNFILAVSAAIGIAILVNIIYDLTEGPYGEGQLNRISLLLGGNFRNGGYIQTCTFIAFFWAILETLQCKVGIANEKYAFNLKFLPFEKPIMSYQDVIELQEKIQNHKMHTHFVLADVINTACTKFKMGKSVPEIIDIVSIQVKINKEKSEYKYTDIRFLNWVIPSLGFIGTVIGISQALKIANSGDLNLITATLGVAFDTTLLALVLSIISMRMFHSLEKQTDELHVGIEEFVMKNLINKIEVESHEQEKQAS